MKLSGPVRRGSSTVWRRINKLKRAGYIATEGTPIMGGGVAYPLTKLGQETLDNLLAIKASLES